MSDYVVTSTNGIRTLAFTGTLDPLLAAGLAPIIQYLVEPAGVFYVPLALWSGASATLPVGPAEQRTLVLKYAAWLRGDTVSDYAIDFTLGNVACRLTFPPATLGAFCALTSSLIAGRLPTALSAPFTLTFLTEPDRRGDLGNAFGDPLAGADD